MGSHVNDESPHEPDRELWRSKFKAVDAQGRDNHAAVERLLELMDAMADLLAEGEWDSLSNRIRDTASQIRRGDATGFRQFVFTYGKEGIDDVYFAPASGDASSLRAEADDLERTFVAMAREALPLAEGFRSDPKRLLGVIGRLRTLWG